MIRPILLAATIAAVTPASAAPQPGDAAVIALVDASTTARRTFDQAALARLVAPDFVEISPIGEVDPRDRMLGFYAADRKQPTPAITTDERSVRMSGNLAIVTERQSVGERAVRVVHVARRDRGTWRLVSVQYTPIRTPRPA